MSPVTATSGAETAVSAVTALAPGDAPGTRGKAHAAFARSLPHAEPAASKTRTSPTPSASPPSEPPDEVDGPVLAGDAEPPQVRALRAGIEVVNAVRGAAASLSVWANSHGDLCVQVSYPGRYIGDGTEADRGRLAALRAVVGVLGLQVVVLHDTPDILALGLAGARFGDVEPEISATFKDPAVRAEAMDLVAEYAGGAR